ncbi:DUF4129 domain-containing protein [Kutzneria albida]|uniref:Putative secreted protein n=1 Tax=Kutzneria albida DSM 43870 TaxID=1449976 RepID=W5W575_9PSEU|nr:DUF4129 domain-containing protein [Kutzneria albida]AHH95920.1 putative secreted protein [Kutzneria albida DSM 43870]
MRARLPLLLSLAALLLLAALAARGRSPVTFSAPTFQPAPITATGTTSPQPDGYPPTAVGGVIDLFALVLILVILLLGAAGLVALLRLRPKLRVRGTADPVTTEDSAPTAVSGAVLAQRARTAAAQLRAREGGPPGDRVIAAWVGLEASATASGTTRRPQQTPTEFVAAVLAAHHVDAQALARLRALYVRARFDQSAQVSDADAESAAQALDRVAIDLAAAR